MFEVKFFPIYGAAIGVNYWDSFIGGDIETEDLEESIHMIQVFVLLFGFSIIWYNDL